MTVDYTEEAFESAIEEHLLQSGGYSSGNPKTFGRQLCLDLIMLIAFNRRTLQRDLRQMEALGIISRKGVARKSYYVLGNKVQ